MAGEQLLVIDDSPTVLRVVEGALAKAGFRVATATGGAAGLALARELDSAPVLVLLDGVMPDLDGAACCRVLAADPRLSNVPIVLMVTKGEDLEDRLARAPNVVDYITKPFSPDAITAVVTHVIQKKRQGMSTAAAPPDAVSEALSHATDGAARAARQADVQARAALDELRAALAQRIESYQQESGKWDLGEVVRTALDDVLLQKLLSTYDVRTGGGARDGTEGHALAGDLGAIAISEVLSLLQEKTQTGCLRVVEREARVELYLRRGKVDFAAAVGVSEELLLGRFAVEAGALTPDALGAVLDERARATTKPALFGADLMARGLITLAQLKQAMTRQTSELAYETLRWTQGRFSFQDTTEALLPELARDAALAISVDTLLLEGFRRVDEWRVIEREIDSFDLVFVPNEGKIAEVARGQLTRDEIAVLEFVNGRTTVKEIIRTLRMGSFDVSKILFRLLRTKLIRRRVSAGVA
jgi:DNA-binding response OmpR family regulator